MLKHIKKLILVIRRKGILETFIKGIKLLLEKVLSLVRITILRLRGYNIDYSVILRGHTEFFQSIKFAINISGGVTLGGNTRITCGGTGKIYIMENVHIDDYSFIMAQDRITVGENTTIAPFCFITDFNHEYKNKNISVMKQGYSTSQVKIGNNVWIGTHCVVLPGVKIGSGSVIGAGSIVTHNIPSDSIAVGNPAKVIKKIICCYHYNHII